MRKKTYYRFSVRIFWCLFDTWICVVVFFYLGFCVFRPFFCLLAFNGISIHMCVRDFFFFFLSIQYVCMYCDLALRAHGYFSLKFLAFVHANHRIHSQQLLEIYTAPPQNGMFSSILIVGKKKRHVKKTGRLI